MSIRLIASYAAAGALTVYGAIGITGAAKAQANVWKECGTQYQVAKAADELNGQSWRDFLKACRVRIAERMAPAAVPGPSDATNTRDSFLKECGAQYRVAKAANELKGQSWLDFLKACRARIAEQPALGEAGATASPPASIPAAESTIAPPPAAAPAPIAAPAATPAPAISEFWGGDGAARFHADDPFRRCSR